MNELTFLGDVYLDENENGFELHTEDLSEYVYNFEYAYYDKETPHALNKALLKSTKDICGTFKKLPIAVDINNNHVFDYCDDGVKGTIDYLESNNIKYFGSGKKGDNCNNPIIIDINGKKIALMGYYNRDRDRVKGDEHIYEQAFFDEDRFLNDVKIAKAKGADYIIPSIHWGVEHSPGYTPKQQKAGRFMIDNGADIVIGHHSHCIQPIEFYNGKYIIYSLGNFAFNDIYTQSWFIDEYTSECMHCRRWYKWSRESLGVSIDVNNWNVRFRKFIQKKDYIYELNMTSDNILMKYSKVSNVGARTFIRKVILSSLSFVFFKGHIFYFKGFEQIMRMFIKMHIKDKDMKYPE